MAPSRKKGAELPPWVKPGAVLEVMSDEKGYEGGRLEAKVVDVLSPRKCRVQYNDLREKNMKSPLKEVVPAEWLRPRPPALCGAASDHSAWRPGHPVEGWERDTWWVGEVRARVGGPDGDSFRVYFPDSNELLTLHHTFLRTRQDWVNGRWRTAKPGALPKGGKDISDHVSTPDKAEPPRECSHGSDSSNERPFPPQPPSVASPRSSPSSICHSADGGGGSSGRGRWEHLGDPAESPPKGAGRPPPQEPLRRRGGSGRKAGGKWSGRPLTSSSGGERWGKSAKSPPKGGSSPPPEGESPGPGGGNSGAAVADSCAVGGAKKRKRPATAAGSLAGGDDSGAAAGTDSCAVSGAKKRGRPATAASSPAGEPSGGPAGSVPADEEREAYFGVLRALWGRAATEAAAGGRAACDARLTLECELVLSQLRTWLDIPADVHWEGALAIRGRLEGAGGAALA